MGFAAKRRRLEAAMQLQLQASAARGDPKDLKKQVKELTKP